MRRELFGPDPHDTVKSVIDDGERRLREIGVVVAAYFLTPAFHAPTSPQTVVVNFGVSHEVGTFLSTPTTFTNDPFPDHIMKIGRPVTLEQALVDLELNDAQRDFVAYLKANGLFNGLGVPLFGPNGRDAYSIFDLGRPIGNDEHAIVERIVEIAQTVHLRVCMLIERDHREPVTISRREAEVLNWIARGKSNADVATILGLSAGTIDTFVRRLYTKLSVNDRISAVLAGISRGLVQL